MMAAGLTFSKIYRGQSSERSGHSKLDYNSLKCNLGLLNLNVYQVACLGGGLRSPSASSLFRL